jgi:catechol 2,3-dioxygenase-like lactoylglutathione lyase family enzyme
VVVDDMARSLTFYELLGFKFPVEAYGEIHVEVELPGGLQIYWDCTQQWASRYAPDYRPGPHGRVALGFKVDSAGDVDALFTKLKNFGYKVDRTPWDAPWGVRYAMVYDPDGNLVEIYSPRPLISKDAPGEGAHSDPGGGGGR